MVPLHLAEEDLATLKRAYELLTRIGNETAQKGRPESTSDGWDDNIDLAHHNLALVIICAEHPEAVGYHHRPGP